MVPRLRKLRARFYLWPIMNLPVGTLDRPIESFLAMLCIIAGLAQLIGPAEQRSVNDSLPGPLVTMWSLMLVVGGILTVVGVTRDHPVTERSGLKLLSGSSFIYSICAVGFLGWDSVYTVCITVAFGIATLLRSMMIGVQRAALMAMRKEMIRVRTVKRDGG